MARIFYGRRDMLNDAVLEAVRALEDDFWVLAEFDLDRRNIDWLIIRAVPDNRPDGRFSPFYLTELKQTSVQLTGGEDGPWFAKRNGVATEIVPNHRADENYWHQAINVTRVVRRWFYNNQRHFISLERPEHPEASFTLWPALLILSNPPGMQHRLPLKPANRFGAFHFDLQMWLDTLKNWEVKKGIQLTATELARLVDVIGLQELPEPVATTQRAAEQDSAPGLDWLEGFARWARGIEDRLSCLEGQYHVQQAVGTIAIDLENRLTRMEAELNAFSMRPAKGAAEPAGAAAKPKRAPAKPNSDGAMAANGTVKAAKRPVKPTKAAAVPAQDPAERSLDDIERMHFVTALTNLRAKNKSRTASMLFHELNRLIGGETLKQRNYYGYGSARALLERAKREKLIRYGPVDGTGMPTIYAYDETATES